MNVSFICPFATEQDHCFELVGLRNYISHLKKCCKVAVFVQDDENLFHLCPYCVQVFISLQDVQIHRNECKQKNMCKIKDDNKWSIKLGLSASEQLDQLFNLINVGIMKTQDRQGVAKPSHNYSSKLPYQRTQILPQQKRTRNQEMEEDCFILEETGSKILQFKVYERDSVFKPMRLRFFNEFSLPSIEVRFFQHKVTIELLLQLLTNKFNVVVSSKENFIKSKVMEFVDDIEGDIEQELEDVVYYSLKKEKNGSSSIWILANEESLFFKQFITDYSWALFKFSSNKVQQETGIVPPKVQSIIILSILQAQKMTDLQIKKEKFKTLLIQDQQLTFQIQYENGLTIQAQKQIKDQFQLNSKQQVQMMMNDSMTKNISQVIKQRYDEQVLSQQNEQLQIIQANLQKYLEDKKQEQKLEAHFKIKSSEEILAKYQPMVEKLFDEEEQLKDLENEFKRRYLILDEEEKTLIQEQKIPRRLPSQNQKRPVIRINQELCIECKRNQINTIIKPCQHCLFCEQCFIKLSQKGIQCPLKNSKRCTRTNFLKKCLTLQFVQTN